MRSLIPRAVSALMNLLYPAPEAKINAHPTELPTFADVLLRSMHHHWETNNLDEKTREKHQYHFNNILAFLKQTGQERMPITEIRLKHAEQMRYWLHKNVKAPGGKPISVDHSTRHLRMCRRACAFAVRQEFLDHNPLTDIETARSAPKDIFSLNVDEVRVLERYHSETIPQRNVIVHKFLYQCFTGLSHMDLPFDQHDIVLEHVRDKNGVRRPVYLVTSAKGRGKTKRKYWAVFTEKARKIRELYPDGFPEMHLQTENRTIKKVAKELGIKHWDMITTHTGRKTFATLKREEGYSIPAIAVMLGNTEEVARKHYVGGDKCMLLGEYLERELMKELEDILSVA